MIVKTILPFWYDGNGYHLFLINGWRIVGKVKASELLTGLQCGIEHKSAGGFVGCHAYSYVDYYHIFSTYSEFYFGDILYSIYWPEGIFKKGRRSGYSMISERIEYGREKEFVYGWDLSYGVTCEDFIKYLKNRLKLINNMKDKLTEYKKEIPFKLCSTIKL